MKKLINPSILPALALAVILANCSSADNENSPVSSSSSAENWCIYPRGQQCLQVLSPRCPDDWILVPACPYSSSSGGASSSASDGSSSSFNDASSSSNFSNSSSSSNFSNSSSSSSSVGGSSSSLLASSSSVATPSSSSSNNSFTDPRDNQTYRTVKIGNQTWMAENLNYAAPGSVCHSNNESNCVLYGRLYGWATAENVCPEGWHLPTKDEWDELSNFVGGSDIDAKHLKATSGWWSEDGNGLDSYGFTARPGGAAYYNSSSSSSIGFYSDLGGYAWWWSSSAWISGGIQSTVAIYGKWLSTNNDKTYWADFTKSHYLASVRCIKD